MKLFQFRNRLDFHWQPQTVEASKQWTHQPEAWIEGWGAPNTGAEVGVTSAKSLPGQEKLGHEKVPGFIRKCQQWWTTLPKKKKNFWVAGCCTPSPQGVNENKVNAFSSYYSLLEDGPSAVSGGRKARNQNSQWYVGWYAIQEYAAKEIC